MIENLIKFLDTNAAGLTVLITLIAGVYKFWQFVNVKKADARQRDYENFHNLIQKLVMDKNEPEGRPFIDVQIATVYELKNYPNYYPVSKRILQRMETRLKGKNGQEELVQEITHMIYFMNCSWIRRKILRLRSKLNI